jgi:hypothetical protein
MAKELYKFEVRLGDATISGMFISTEEEVSDLYEKEIYFGNILGPESEVAVKMSDDLFLKLEVSANAVDELEQNCGTSIVGYNPLDYASMEETDFA